MTFHFTKKAGGWTYLFNICAINGMGSGRGGAVIPRCVWGNNQ